ncbi:hypothetical protein GSI_05845 [Ganoderma sinense ZZ0214-1]|uniref:Uncharacterized protein n=1 Tax=Ganoderma sinense ZZ0214-1 TaxID=1077348 RepID=A0A2G8SC23_9APHY|nr:hypothetical protein GSI_05845 [Ganoderma sinense ZZ0214-1]
MSRRSRTPRVLPLEAICALLDSAEPLRNLDVWLRGVVDTQAWTPSLLAHVAPALESARGLLAVTPLPRDPLAICHPAMPAHAEANGMRAQTSADSVDDEEDSESESESESEGGGLTMTADDGGS